MDVKFVRINAWGVKMDAGLNLPNRHCENEER